MKYKVFKNTGISNDIVGYYDENYIYDSNNNKLFEYGDGKIKTIDYIQKTVGYYKDNTLYDNQLFSNVLGHYSDQKVYEGIWDSKIIGFYEGNRGICTVALLFLNDKSRLVKSESFDSIEHKENDLGEGLFGIAVGTFITLIVTCILIYAILKARAYFGVEHFSLYLNYFNTQTQKVWMLMQLVML